MNTSLIDSLSSLLSKLESYPKTDTPKLVFVGFDGFVDKIKKAVRQKRNFKTVYIKTLKEFAERIQSATGKSGQIELVTQQVKLGGNAPILANTLGRLGVRTTCMGSMGHPERHSVFSEMNENCDVISVLNPGLSDALEFEDGKMIFSELDVFDKYNWSYIKKTVGLDKISARIVQSDLLAFVDWVNLPHSSEIWEGVLNDIIKPSGRKDFLFFFDFCDPSKKTTEQIDEVLDLVSCFSFYGKVTLGLNENETIRIWSSINGVDSNDPLQKGRIPGLKEAGEFLHKAMNIDCLLIHPTVGTIAFHQREVIEMQGRLVTRPKVLTGGGDNLNAGYCLGMLAGFPLHECMLLGMVASGAYIQNGSSPDLEELSNYIRVWIDELTKAPKEPVVNTQLTL